MFQEQFKQTDAEGKIDIKTFASKVSNLQSKLIKLLKRNKEVDMEEFFTQSSAYEQNVSFPDTVLISKL